MTKPTFLNVQVMENPKLGGVSHILETKQKNQQQWFAVYKVFGIEWFSESDSEFECELYTLLAVQLEAG